MDVSMVSKRERKEKFCFAEVLFWLLETLLGTNDLL
jgi:hypothetical protein